MKKLICILLVVCVCFAVIGCANTPNGQADYDVELDNAYTLIIEGVTSEPIVVTKLQIFEIAKTKAVVYDADNPCYASDKTDDDGNLIPRTLKGVYLDDILAEYGDGGVSSYYSAMTMKGEDGYDNVITSNCFNPEQGGSKMIIAYEYEGSVLHSKQRSGALRAIFPDQAANYWVKSLKTIIFSDAALTPPSPQNIYFLEFLKADYYGSFTREGFTYYGVDLDKLFEEEILQAEVTDKMYINAWDYVSNGTDYFYREYTNWKNYDYYRNALLVFQEKEGEGQLVDNIRAPIFDGQNIQKGMSVKNMLALTVGDSAIVSLDIAFERFDTDNTNEIELHKLLALINMEEGESYILVDTSDNEVLIDESLFEQKIYKEGGVYKILYNENAIEIKAILTDK